MPLDAPKATAKQFARCGWRIYEEQRDGRSRMILQLADYDAFVPGLPSSRASVEVVRESVYDIQTPPRFLLGTLPLEISYPLFAELVTGPVLLRRIRDAYVTIDGIVVVDGQALYSPTYNHPDYHVQEVVDARLGGQLDLPVRKIAGPAVVLSGPGYSVYGHWLIDLLPRLWVLSVTGHDPRSLRFLLPNTCPDFVVPLLKFFGLAENQLEYYDERVETVLVSDLLLPTNLRRGSRLDSSFLQARDYLWNRAAEGHDLDPSEDSPRKIFISRRDADPSRSLVNRAEIEHIAQERGFSVIYPEEHDFLQQMKIFKGAEFVAGEYGSGLHNSMFSCPGLNICALRGSSIHPGFIQSSIAAICDQNIGYVLGSTPIEAIDQSFVISPHAFDTAISCMELVRAKQLAE